MKQIEKNNFYHKLKNIIPAPIKNIIYKIRSNFQKFKLLRDFYSDLKIFKNQKKELKDKDFIFGKLYPILEDKYKSSGVMKGGYFHQDLLVAQRIFENNPKLHVDVGSRIDGFVAHVASFREIEIIDIRPPENTVKNITFKQLDFMKELPNSMTSYCDSLSCLHAIEHFGLGRYGDVINYNGHLLGMDNLYRILKKGGILYFSVPIGEPQQIMFHAHRIFSVKYLLKKFEGKYFLNNFSYVDDNGDLFENIKDLNYGTKTANDSFGCKLGLGIFELEKI